MKNIYMEDRLHAMKIVAYEQNINISGKTSSQEEREKKRKKRKWSRLSLRGTTGSQNHPEAHLGQTPPDKTARLEAQSSRKEKQWLARELKWNMRRKLMDKLSILEYDKFKGFVVQFPDDVDWIPSLRSKDVQILEKHFFSFLSFFFITK